MENLVGGRDVGDGRHGEAVKAEIDHPLLVDRVRDRAHEAQVGEPSILRIGHAVMDVMIGVAVEGEEQRAGVDTDFLERDAELFLLFAQIDDLLGARRINVDLPGEKAQVLRVAVGHDLQCLAVQPRQPLALFVVHPVVRIANEMDELRLHVTRHLELAQADNLFRRRVDAPGMVEPAGL